MGRAAVYYPSPMDAIIPQGGVILWSGTVNAIPAGWALCDGTNGTPDLRGRFVVGAGSAYAVGDTGGKATHTLTVEEMPSHSHTFQYAPYNASGGSSYAIVEYQNVRASIKATSVIGSSQPHNNLPPYYALCYIMKL